MGIGIIVINVNIKRHTRVPLRHILNWSIKKNLRNAMNLFMTVNNIIVINVNVIANKRVLLGNTLNQSIMGTGIIVINVNMKRHKSVQSRHTLNLSITVRPSVVSSQPREVIKSLRHVTLTSGIPLTDR